MALKRAVLLLLALSLLQSGVVGCSTEQLPEPTSMPGSTGVATATQVQPATRLPTATVVPTATTPVTSTASPSNTPAFTPTAARSATPMPTSLPTWTPTVAPPDMDELVDVVCLTMTESYQDIEGTFSLPVEQTLRDMLGRIGLTVVAEGESCDATLAVTFEGVPRGASCDVHGEGRKFCYTGAAAKLLINVTLSTGQTYTFLGSGKIEPVEGTVFRCPGPAEAPLGMVWPAAMLDGLEQVWGSRALVAGLGDTYLRGPAISALRTGSVLVELVPVLVENLGSDDPEMRSGSALALGWAGSEEGVADALIQALVDEDSQVRVSAATALGFVGPQEGVVSALVQAMHDDEAQVRVSAAQALGSMGPAEGVVEALVEAVESDGAEDVRYQAAWALGQMGADAIVAVPALIEAMGDSGMNFGFFLEALKMITYEDLGPDPNLWRQWWEQRQE